LAAAGDSADAMYARAMLRLRDGKTDGAKKLFYDALTAREHEGGVLVRARARLAAIALAEKQLDDAKTQIEAILAAQPAHERAQALKKRLDEATAAAAAPPKPEPQPAKPEPAKPGGAKPGRPKPERPPGGAEGELPAAVRGGDYDGLVARADKLAENGDCGGASRYYEKALEARPGGVEALTGIGYCFLDRKDYGRARPNFPPRPGISPRHPDGALGLAAGDPPRG